MRAVVLKASPCCEDAMLMTIPTAPRPMMARMRIMRTDHMGLDGYFKDRYIRDIHIEDATRRTTKDQNNEFWRERYAYVMTAIKPRAARSIEAVYNDRTMGRWIPPQRSERGMVGKTRGVST